MSREIVDPTIFIHCPSPEEIAAEKRKRMLIMFAIVFCLVAVALGCFIGLSTWAQDRSIKEAQESRAATQAQLAIREAERAEQHVHNYEIVSATVHHDAETESVSHPAVYNSAITYETVCNVCKDTNGQPTVISGMASQHQADTGHGYTPNYPISTNVLVSEAYDEVVVVSEGYDEQVPSYQVCTICGERKPLEQS